MSSEKINFAPRFQRTLDDLASAAWFVNVGQPAGERVRVVHSWKEAQEACAKLSYENLLLGAHNGLLQAVRNASVTCAEVWNESAAAAAAAAKTLIAARFAAIETSERLPPYVRAVIEWDVQHLLIEAHYADVVKPAFFAAQGYWYVTGRFPCGWDGDFPDGKLVVF